MGQRRSCRRAHDDRRHAEKQAKARPTLALTAPPQAPRTARALTAHVTAAHVRPPRRAPATCPVAVRDC